jgi:peptidoglycan L-alanyl-D-glutamate endopeptidase CwlK
LRFAYVYRSVNEQNKLFAQRPKVTNARGGQSIHNYGMAFDIVILKDKDNNGTFETASFDIDEHWMKVVKFFKAKGWTWGGDWKSFKDAPHFEKTFGHTWRTLQIREMFIDNGLKYPKL